RLVALPEENRSDEHAQRDRRDYDADLDRLVHAAPPFVSLSLETNEEGKTLNRPGRNDPWPRVAPERARSGVVREGPNYLAAGWSFSVIRSWIRLAWALSPGCTRTETLVLPFCSPLMSIMTLSSVVPRLATMLAPRASPLSLSICRFWLFK